MGKCLSYWHFCLWVTVKNDLFLILAIIQMKLINWNPTENMKLLYALSQTIGTYGLVLSILIGCLGLSRSTFPLRINFIGEASRNLTWRLSAFRMGALPPDFWPLSVKLIGLNRWNLQLSHRFHWGISTLEPQALCFGSLAGCHGN